MAVGNIDDAICKFDSLPKGTLLPCIWCRKKKNKGAHYHGKYFICYDCVKSGVLGILIGDSIASVFEETSPEAARDLENILHEVRICSIDAMCQAIKKR